MSLLYGLDNKPNTTLLALWKEVHKKGSQEAEALSFWQHYLSKHVFKEEHWICDAEISPQPGSQSRVDRGVRYLSSDDEIVILCWHEAKGNASSADVRECEKQALTACVRTLKTHPWQRHIFAFTTVKTQAKAWSYERGDTELTPLFEESYIEAHSSDGHKIRKSFRKMKVSVPAKIAGDPGSTRVTGSLSARPERHTIPSSPFPRTSAQGSQEQAFTRNTTSPQPSSSGIKEKYKQVQAERVSGNSYALHIRTRHKLITVNQWEMDRSEEKIILYSDKEGIWVYARDVK